MWKNFLKHDKDEGMVNFFSTLAQICINPKLYSIRSKSVILQKIALLRNQLTVLGSKKCLMANFVVHTIYPKDVVLVVPPHNNISKNEK